MTTFKVALAAAVVAVGFAGTASAQPTLKGGYYPTPVPGVRVFPNTGGIPVGYPYPIPQRVDFDYVVLYKASIFTPVRVYGTFETLRQAQYAARRLEFAGLPVRIERVRDFGGFGW